MPKPERTYLAGPMSGIEAFNFPAFHEAARRLRLAGLEVVNPAELDEAKGHFDGIESDDPIEIAWARAQYLRRDLRWLVHCDSVTVLSGWAQSIGAQVEVFAALAIGMPVFEYLVPMAADRDLRRPYKAAWAKLNAHVLLTHALNATLGRERNGS